MTISSNREPILWLRGKTAGLGPYRSDLVPTYWRWEQDPCVLLGYGRQTPESLEARLEGYEHQARGTLHQARFTVYDLTGPTPLPVGTTALVIDHQVRTAEYFILLGEHRGRGIGGAATLLTLDYAFHITNLRNVWLQVLAANAGAVRAYERAGFRLIGRRRQSGYWLGEPCDEILMDAIPSEFPGPSIVHELAGEGLLDPTASGPTTS